MGQGRAGHMGGDPTLQVQCSPQLYISAVALRGLIYIQALL